MTSIKPIKIALETPSALQSRPTRLGSTTDEPLSLPALRLRVVSPYYLCMGLKNLAVNRWSSLSLSTAMCKTCLLPTKLKWTSLEVGLTSYNVSKNQCASSLTKNKQCSLSDLNLRPHRSPVLFQSICQSGRALSYYRETGSGNGCNGEGRAVARCHRME